VAERSSEFRDTLLELIGTSPEPADHPSPDRWLAYHRGELPAGDEAELQEHLVRCRGCFDLSEAAAAFAEPGEEAGQGQEMETPALWRLLRSQLDPAPGPPRENVVEISRRRPRGFHVPRTLAALFFVAVVGLTTWSLRLQSALETLRAPQPNAPIIDFSDGERLPLSAERTLSASTGPWMFVFHPADELQVYRLALREAASGRELWSYELRPDEDFALTIQLREPLPPGRYRFELADGSGGRAGRVLQTQLLRVVGE
jgi:hypothetical protein